METLVDRFKFLFFRKGIGSVVLETSQGGFHPQYELVLSPQINQSSHFILGNRMSLKNCLSKFFKFCFF